MGNDGGSIPKRCQLIKPLKNPKPKKNQNLISYSRAKYCSLSKEKLKKPIVADKLGQIFNKKSIIENLINKNLPNKTFKHIKSLKDVKELKCEFSNDGKIKCKISNIDFSGMNKFFFIWNCGDVLSLDAIKNLNMTNKCLLCGEEFKKEDLISLNYTKEEKEKIQKKILLERKEKNLLLQLKRKREENNEKNNENNFNEINNEINNENNNENTIIKKKKLI